MYPSGGCGVKGEEKLKLFSSPFDFSVGKFAEQGTDDNCITCNSSSCSSPGNYGGPTWTKPTLNEFCPCRTVNDFAPENCFDPTFDCYSITATPVSCDEGSCLEFALQECSSTDQCEDNDGDGHYGAGPRCIIGDDCDDEDNTRFPGNNEISDQLCGDEKDNDCDRFVDCKDSDCRQSTSICGNECDQDEDGYLSEDCEDGDDCDDEDVDIFPGNIENTEELCNDGKDNDCNGDEDCDDDNCKSPTNFCCAETEICGVQGDEDCNGLADCEDIESCSGDPACTGGGGGGYTATYYHCYSEWLVTTYYYCHSEGCSYLGETWEYVGTQCQIVQ